MNRFVLFLVTLSLVLADVSANPGTMSETFNKLQEHINKVREQHVLLRDATENDDIEVIQAACRPDHDRLCPQTDAPYEIAACMWQHWDQVGANCKATVEREVTCVTELEQYCTSVTDFTEAQACLMAHYAVLSVGCQQRILPSGESEESSEGTSESTSEGTSEGSFGGRHGFRHPPRNGGHTHSHTLVGLLVGASILGVVIGLAATMACITMCRHRRRARASQLQTVTISAVPQSVTGYAILQDDLRTAVVVPTAPPV